MERPVLRFHENGRFRILMMSDFHAGERFSPKLTKGIDELCRAAEPDFVMIGGDQCLWKYTEEETAAYMAEIMEPVIRRGIPWGHVFGNHDRENPCGVPIEVQERAMESLPGCLSEAGPEEIHGVGNYRIPVLSRSSDEPAFYIWAMDSLREMKDMAEMFGLDPDTQFTLPDHFGENMHGGTPLFDQIQWYWNASVESEKRYGRRVPGVMFMHIPMPEYLHIVRNPEECSAVGSKRTSVDCSENSTGLFLASLERGDIKGFFFGHEHLTDLEGRYCGVIMACDACIGYDMSAHDDLRGGRIIDLFESDGTVQTHTIKLMDLMGRDAMRDPDYFEGGCKYFIRKLD